MDADDRAQGKQLVAAGTLTPTRLREILDVQRELAALGEPRRLIDLVAAESRAQQKPACDDTLATRLARFLRLVTRLAP